MHLMAYVGVGGNWIATLMANHPPRFDLALHPEYARKNYSGAWASYWLELCCQLGVQLFVSVDPSVRLVQGPNALALQMD